MAVIHGSLTAGVELEVQISTDSREAGIMHKGGASPMYARWQSNFPYEADDEYTILPGMRRWLPAPSGETRSTLFLRSGSNCEWEIES